MIWCRMKFKPQKYSSLSLRKGKVNQNINFLVGGQRMPTVSEDSMKRLGHWFDVSWKDINQAKETSRTLKKKIPIRLIAVLYKVWCLQHILILMLLWSLVVCEIATSTVKSMEAKINKILGFTSKLV